MKSSIVRLFETLTEILTENNVILTIVSSQDMAA